MIRVLFPRLTEFARGLRHFLFRIARPFLRIEAITSYQANYALQLVERGEHDEAIAILNETIDSNSGFPLLYALRGSLYELQLRHDKALVDYNEAIDLDEVGGLVGVNVDFYVGRGRVWAGLGEYERAIDDFNTAIELEPRPEAYSARGDAFVAIGKYIAAMDDYERVIARRPDANVYSARGTAYLYLNLFDDALNDFKTAVRLDPTMATPYAMLGNIHLQQGDHGAAAEEFTQVIALMADSFDVDFLNFINTDIQSRLYGFAVQDVGSAYCGRGISRSRTGDIAGALSDFNAAIRNMPEHASFYLARATAYAEHGEHAEAIQDLEMASQLDDRSADTHCMKAWVHFCEEEFDEALHDCHIMIGLSPRWATAYCLRGLVHLRLGDYRDAIDDFGRAIELEPGKPQSWQEPWHAQRPGLNVTLDLDRPVAYAYRGLAYLLLGDEAKGKEDIVEAAVLGYAQSEIEDEIAALISNERDRRAMRDSSGA